MIFFRQIVPLLCVISSISSHAEVPTFQQAEPEELIIHNRILAKVDTKTISVIDVMKKMDMFLQKHYPQFIHSKMARFQFYSTQWQEYLAQMIDQELMLADAERLELKVSDAEVREEVLQRFGPNIMITLDTMGLSYDEMRKMVHDEMIVQRMIWLRVNSKALNQVNSRDVKLAYAEYCKKHPELEEWEYQVLSIRSANQQASQALANKAFELLDQAKSDTNHKNTKYEKIALNSESEAIQNPLDLNSLATQLQSSEDKSISIQVSSDLLADEKSISETHKEVLKTLSENTFSAPIQQINRVDHSIVYRIYHLKKHSKKTLPPFENLADQLKDELLQEAASKENSSYIVKLREKLGYDEKQMQEILPQDFQPFAIR